MFLILTENKFMRGMTSVVKAVCVILLAAIVITCVIQVVARYVFKYSFVWVEELATWSLVWSTFMGSTLAVIDGAHPRIDALLLLMNHKLRCIVEAFDNFVCAGVACVLAYYTFPLLEQNKAYLSPGLRAPMAILYFALALGGILMTVFFIVIAIDFLLKIGKEEVST